MNPEPHHRATGTNSSLLRTAHQGVDYDDAAKSIHQVARDYCQTSVGDRELPLPDVPLIVEYLLVQANKLAVAGAPHEAIEEILNHVTALREGRG